MNPRNRFPLYSPGAWQDLLTALLNFECLSIPCRDCGALPGEPCWVTRDGKRTSEAATAFHQWRNHNGRTVHDVAVKTFRERRCPDCGVQLPSYRVDGWHRCPALPPEPGEDDSRETAAELARLRERVAELEARNALGAERVPPLQIPRVRARKP